MIQRLRIRLFAGESGQTLVEYALIIAMISIACIAALSLVGTKISDVLNTLAVQL